MKKIFIIILIAIGSLGLNAQVTEKEEALKKTKQDTTQGWKYGGTVTLNLSQVSLTNWASGGQNSISANGLVSLFARYKQDKHVWENYLDLAYGVLKQDENKSWWKTDDKLDFTSKYGYRASSKLYYAALLNFKTQFANGYNYPNDSVKISAYLAPAYVVGAVGVDYKPNDDFTIFVAPLTAKYTIVNDATLADVGAFGVEPATYDGSGNLISHGEKIRSEFGGYMRLFVKQNIIENISVQSKIDLFSNYIEKPQNIDVNWELLVSMKVSQFITTTLFTNILYDDDVLVEVDQTPEGEPILGKRVQRKQIIGVGFSYKF